VTLTIGKSPEIKFDFEPLNPKRSPKMGKSPGVKFEFGRLPKRKNVPRVKFDFGPLNPKMCKSPWIKI
jgi:hypothetical protein